MQTKKKAAIHERKILTDRQLFSLKLLWLRCGQNFIIDQLIGLIKGFDHLGRFRMEMDHKIWYYLIFSDKIFPRKPCQHPDLLAALQRTGSFVSNTFTQQVIGELKCFFVLHNAVAVRHHAQNSIIGAADICAIKRD